MYCNYLKMWQTHIHSWKITISWVKDKAAVAWKVSVVDWRVAYIGEFRIVIVVVASAAVVISHYSCVCTQYDPRTIFKTKTLKNVPLLAECCNCRYYRIYFSGDFVLWKIDTRYTFVEVWFISYHCCVVNMTALIRLMCTESLWPPYVVGQAIIFLPCGSYLLSSFLFPRLISAVADWMSTILAHMVWP